jgi:hypothetical protein
LTEFDPEYLVRSILTKDFILFYFLLAKKNA